jgi:hypothetical protein
MVVEVGGGGARAIAGILAAASTRERQGRCTDGVRLMACR